jgi:hypothetical protein
VRWCTPQSWGLFPRPSSPAAVSGCVGSAARVLCFREKCSRVAGVPGCLSYVFVSVPHAPGGQWKEALAGSCRSWWCMQSPRHWRWSVGGESSVQTQDGDNATTASSAPVHRAMPSAQPPLQAPLQATLQPSLQNAHTKQRLIAGGQAHGTRHMWAHIFTSAGWMAGSTQGNTELGVANVYFARLLAHTFFISSLFFSARRWVPSCTPR